MPGDMTMHQPRAWIVRLERNDEEPTAWERSGIATHGVFEVEYCGLDVEGTFLLSKDVKIMSMQMDWVINAFPHNFF